MSFLLSTDAWSFWARGEHEEEVYGSCNYSSDCNNGTELWPIHAPQHRLCASVPRSVLLTHPGSTSGHNMPLYPELQTKAITGPVTKGGVRLP